jgi:hypothetical protein
MDSPKVLLGTDMMAPEGGEDGEHGNDHRYDDDSPEVLLGADMIAPESGEHGEHGHDHVP